jgi:hypothetical protein
MERNDFIKNISGNTLVFTEGYHNRGPYDCQTSECGTKSLLEEILGTCILRIMCKREHAIEQIYHAIIIDERKSDDMTKSFC